jgi:hypothetical protein
MTDTQDTQTPVPMPATNAGSRANFGPAIIEGAAPCDKPIPLVRQGNRWQAGGGRTFALHGFDHTS